MSATVLPAPLADRGAGERPGLGRLTRVELRKMTDTRAGFWLLLSTALLTIAVVVISGLALRDVDQNLRNFVSIATAPLTILAPIVGILLVTSEWSQRTSLITFALVPRRSRVLAAKLLAAVALGLVGYALCLVAAGVGTAVFGAGSEETWSWSAALFGQNALAVALAMVAGVGFGAVFLSSAPAIVLYFVLPTAWGAIGSIHALEGVAKWLDQSRTMAHVSERALSSGEWARVGTSVALWVLLPVVVGLWRFKRNDVR